MPETSKSAELTEKIVGRQVSLQRLQDFIIEAQTHGVEMTDKVKIDLSGAYYTSDIRTVNLSVPIPSDFTYSPVVRETLAPAMGVPAPVVAMLMTILVIAMVLLGVFVF